MKLTPLQPSGDSILVVLNDFKPDAGDQVFEHPNGKTAEAKTDARAGRWIVSCLGVIEAVTLAASGGDKTCR